MGYVLKPGFWLPPLMLSGEEIEALVLGARWVGARTDGKTRARSARRDRQDHPPFCRRACATTWSCSTLIVAPSKALSAASADLAPIRAAIRAERKLALEYHDAQGAGTERTIWPFGVGYFEEARVVMALVRAQAGIPAFPRRSDRPRAERSRRAIRSSRHRLLKDWRLIEGVAPPE